MGSVGRSSAGDQKALRVEDGTRSKELLERSGRNWVVGTGSYRCNWASEDGTAFQAKDTPAAGGQAGTLYFVEQDRPEWAWS